jgi:hypothetical protein
MNATKVFLTTAEFAAVMNVAEQTARRWHCKQLIDIKPVKVRGRLMWPASAIRKLEAQAAALNAGA